MYCTECGSLNKSDAGFCFSCGVSLNSAESVYEQSQQDAKRELYRLFIGEKKQKYFLSLFQQFEQGGSRYTWNTAAFFMTLPWFLYRKMWGVAALYFVSSVVVRSINKGIPADSVMELLILNILTIAIFGLVIPLLANHLYYHKANKLISNTLSMNGNTAAVKLFIQQKGGTSKVVMLLAIIPLIGILAAIALPAYHSYSLKAKQHNLSAVMNYANSVTSSIGQYYEQNDAMPGSLEAVGVNSLSHPAGVKDVMWQSDRHNLLVWADNVSNNNAWLELKAKTDSDGHIQWRCYAVNIPNEAIPPTCQN